MNSSLIPWLALAPYAAVSLGLAATLVLFISLKAEMRRTARRERRRMDEALARLEQAQSVPQSAEPIIVPVSGSSGMNVTRRVHAMRLLRRGEDMSHIAGALGIPRRELEMLARVQNFVAEQPAAAGANSK